VVVEPPHGGVLDEVEVLHFVRHCVEAPTSLLVWVKQIHFGQ
jgi:hypothetical protein